MTVTGFKEVRIETAEELWDRLGPRLWGGSQNKDLVFRGEGDASWKLVPSVLRNTTDPFRGPRTADGQVIHEFLLLSQFAEFCDQTGVRVPGDSIRFREGPLAFNNQDRYFTRPSDWPNDELLDALALAQHHGVQTRLLDWTRLPFAAVYFAAATSLERYKDWKEDTCLAVWCLDLRTINMYHPRIRVIKPPGSTTTHLAAQAGLFTVHTQDGVPDVVLDVRGLEIEFKIPGDTPLTKFIVPSAQSVKLFDFCSRVGTTAATLFPGASGAAQAVKAWSYYEEADKWLRENADLEPNQRTRMKRLC